MEEEVSKPGQDPHREAAPTSWYEPEQLDEQETPMSSKVRTPVPASPAPSAGGTLTPNLDSVPCSGLETPSGAAPVAMLLPGAGAEPVPGYQLVKRLGQGGFGEVWQATGPGGFPVAMKFIRLGAPSGNVELRALELMKHLRHPNLLGQFGAWRRDETLIVAMELAEGTLLSRHTAAVADGLPGIPVAELLEYMADAARGIDYLNEPRPAEGQPHGIQHRDIKPANLLLVGGCVKVGDFGLAKVLQNTMASNTGSMTLAYSAPECINGTTSHRSDQYSLAVSYCHLRGSRLPFRGTAQQVMFGHLMNPPDLAMLPAAEQVVVARALCKKPEDRWPNCRAFVQALARAARAKPGPVAAPHGRRPEPEVRVELVRDEGPAPSRRRPLGLGYTPDRGALSLLGLIVVACVAFWVSLNFDQVSASIKDFVSDMLERSQVQKPSQPRTLPGHD
jgi:serine/threonine protein kinase